jgi:5,10-methylene-tetrahydrofolate dehydrogenase/methenyl tetrahydrofolate cyclohydrolase
VSAVVLDGKATSDDADGLHPVNLGRLVLGEPGPLPCTPRGIVERACHRNAASHRYSGYLTPVPGGVGPMTRAMLLANVVEAAERAGPS